MTVEMLDTQTGEVRKFEDEIEDDIAVYMWEDGNYSCDCNRHLFFERSVGHEPDFEEAVCGDGRYVILSLTDGEGTLRYSEKAAA